MQSNAFHENQTQVISFAIDQSIKNIETMIPGIVERDMDMIKRTVYVKPAIRRILTNGTRQERGILYDVPVVFPGGGGYEITWDVKKGDTVMIIYSHRGLRRFIENLKSENLKSDDPTDPISDPDINVRVNSYPVVLPFSFKEQDNKININEATDGSINITKASETEKDEDGNDVTFPPSNVRMGKNGIILSIGETGEDGKVTGDDVTKGNGSYIEITKDRINIYSKTIFSSTTISSTL